MGGVSLVDDLDATVVTDALIDRGFVVRPLRGNTIQISPPFITTDEEVRILIEAIDDTLTEQETK
jgi:adenosylmethionine-8-amino-7-oxononanoate aminotransferase